MSHLKDPFYAKIVVDNGNDLAIIRYNTTVSEFHEGKYGLAWFIDGQSYFHAAFVKISKYDKNRFTSLFSSVNGLPHEEAWNFYQKFLKLQTLL